MSYAVIFNILAFDKLEYSNIIFLIIPFLFTYIFENIAVFVDETEMKIIKMLNAFYLTILVNTYLLRAIGIDNIVSWIDKNKFYLIGEMIVALLILNSATGFSRKIKNNISLYIIKRIQKHLKETKK